MSRRSVAVVILLLWAVGLGLMAKRRFGGTDAERLAEAAARVDPVPFYYRVYQGDTQIGVASSSIDTSRRQIRMTDAFEGRMVMRGDTQSVNAKSTTYLSRRFVLDSVQLSVDKAHNQFQRPNQPSQVLPPTALPIALMLTGDPTIGREQNYWMYNPAGGAVQHVTLRISAESLFTVSDSATYDSLSKTWVSTHSDTVRAWSIAPKASGLTVWVDTHGRIVNASEPSGLHVTRTAYEIAVTNWRMRRQ